MKLNRLPEFYLHARHGKKDYRGLAGVERVRVCILALEHSREEFCSAQMQIQVKGLAWMRPENNEAFPRLLPFNSLQAYNLIKSLFKREKCTNSHLKSLGIPSHSDVWPHLPFIPTKGIIGNATEIYFESLLLLIDNN